MPTRLWRHWLSLFHLSWPVVLNRAGLVLMALVSLVMVGRYDTAALAGFALGIAVVMPLLVAGIGCLVGVMAVTAREHGAGSGETPAVALRGLHWAAAVGVAASLPAAFAGPVLLLIGQEPALAEIGARVAWYSAPGVLLHLVFVAATFWLEGTGRTRPGLVAMAGANVANLGLSWLLIGGRLGAPELGADGAALANTLARLVMIVGFLGWMLRLPELAPYRRPVTLWGPGGWAAGREMRRIGLAGGAAYFLETMAFATMVQAAGLLGEAPLAAYSILHNIETTVFMVALGLSVGTAVQIGQAAGAGDRAEARFTGFAGGGAAIGLAALVGLGLFVAAPTVVGFYTSDPTIIARAAPIMAILAVSMTFDAGQVVFGQATRALGDGWGTTLCYMAAFWGVMVPTGLVLAFATPLAEAGLFVGTAAGTIAAASLLALRFRHLLARV
ncbi:MAG TPA: MATE family efflux transporter [Amaricoccus sp.]|nr:MATE family efflux transporter [Amaricoccus sp.]